MSANALLNFISPHHHGQGVPAHQALDAAFHLLAAGKRRLLRCSNGILIGSGRREWQVHARGAARVQRQLLNQTPGAYRAALG